MSQIPNIIQTWEAFDDPNVIYRSTFSVVTGFNFVICTPGGSILVLDHIRVFTDK
jgi:hypothetical protein